MKNFSRRLMKMARRTGIALITGIRKNPNEKLDPKAYYLCMGTIILDLRPHYGWKKARAAAKRIHSRAFIMSGTTINNHIKNSQWKDHKSAWSRYAAR